MAKGKRKTKTTPAKRTPQQPPTRVTEAYQFFGPLPHPSDLQKYNDVLDGAAERIIVMAENQAAHRQALELRAVKTRSRDSFLGLICGCLIGLAGIGGGVYCIANGHAVGGSILGGSTLVSLVGVFVHGSREKRLERESKWKSE